MTLNFLEIVLSDLKEVKPNENSFIPFQFRFKTYFNHPYTMNMYALIEVVVPKSKITRASTNHINIETCIQRNEHG